jgi:predicted nucleotidyltransferase
MVLFGKSRRGILALLYGHVDEEFYLRQIVRNTGLGVGPVQRELKLLTDSSILRRRRDGNQVYYQANPETPIFDELKNIVRKMSGIASDKSLDPVAHRFDVPKDSLARFCRKHHIRKLSLFGSVLRNDFRPDSDVDVLVEFEPGHVPGFAIIEIENELSQLVGRKVDLRTPGDLSRYFRDRVVREARVEYADTKS